MLLATGFGYWSQHRVGNFSMWREDEMMLKELEKWGVLYYCILE
jgi:hypothetical protein